MIKNKQKIPQFRCLPGIDKANKSDVIVDLEDGMLKGFTVSDVQSFLSVVRLCAPISTIIVDHLDFTWFLKKKRNGFY